MNADFSARTDELAHQLRCSLRELAEKIGISQAMLFSYRSGKSAPTLKALNKLEAAERAAGISSDAATLREEPGIYRVTRGPGAAPLRQPDEPTIMERLAAMEREREETKASLAAIMKSLDDLTDLFTNRKPRN